MPSKMTHRHWLELNPGSQGDRLNCQVTVASKYRYVNYYSIFAFYCHQHYCWYEIFHARCPSCYPINSVKDSGVHRFHQPFRNYLQQHWYDRYPRETLLQVPVHTWSCTRPAGLRAADSAVLCGGCGSSTCPSSQPSLPEKLPRRNTS